MSNIVQLVEQSAQRFPDREALCLFDQTLTYGEFLQEIEAVAGGLHLLGIAKGDRVAIFAENCPEYLVTYLAVAKLGAILATINPLFKEGEIGYILHNAEPRLVVVQSALEASFRHCLEKAKYAPEHIITLGASAGAANDLTYQQLREGPPRNENCKVEPSDGVLICYTSGSQARPKPVYKSHEAENFLATSHAKIWHMVPDDKILVTLPLAWLFGLTTSSLACFSAGGTVVLMPHFNPVVAMDRIDQQGITLFAGVMTMFAKMMQVAEESDRKFDLSSLRFCVQGGEPRNEALAQRFTAKFGVAIHDIYATSECSPNFTYDPYRDPHPRPGSCGRILDGVEARLLDGNGKDVPIGEIGELVVRCPGMMLGYFREPILTAEVIQDGWFLSRDLVRVDADGYYYVAGRSKDMIIRGGANIAPPEVEAVIARHPAVAEVAVIGIHDPVYGEAPKACVILRAGEKASEKEIQDYCRERLASFKVPTGVLFMDQFPKGATGKVLKKALRDLILESAAGGAS